MTHYKSRYASDGDLHGNYHHGANDKEIDEEATDSLRLLYEWINDRNDSSCRDE